MFCRLNPELLGLPCLFLKFFSSALTMLELKHDRIANATYCYKKLGCKVSKDVIEKSPLKLEQYE
eukprot:4015192-Ditylum_brightwellii.AAC.1